MDYEPLISVIIPVYNLEREIGRTLDSVCGQSYDKLQIVVVNDGSRDGSLEVCREYAARDGRIRVIDKPNAGLPLARETGLEAAEGEYVHHLDGGDVLEPDAYRKVVAALRAGGEPDFALFGFYHEYADGRLEPSHPWPETLTEPRALLHEIWTTQQYRCVWQYVYKRRLTDRLRFDGRLTLGEDAYYTAQLFYEARSFVRIDEPLLRYRIDEGSMSHARYSDRAMESMLLFPRLIEEFMRDKPEYDIWKEDLLTVRLQVYVLLIRDGRLERMEEWVDEFREAFAKYPDLRTTGFIIPIRKLITLYGRHPLLYRLQLALYKLKGKVR